MKRKYVRKTQFLPFKEARDIIRVMGIKSTRGYRLLSKDHKLPCNIPTAPDEVYKEWKNWYDWLGLNIYLPFRQARCLAHKTIKDLNIKSFGEYRRLAKNNKLPESLPKNPANVYKDNGWISYLDWMGKTDSEVRSKYTVNHNYFKKWTRNRAYVLGLWWADGCIYKYKNRNSYKFIIILHRKDKYLLERVAKDMRFNGVIYDVKNSNCCELTIHSEAIVKDIIGLGGQYRKSKTIRLPNVSKKYLPDFIRGIFDGDGCAYYKRTEKINKASSSICSGSLNFINDLDKVIKTNIDGIITTITSSGSNRIFIKGKTYFYKEPVMCYALNFNRVSSRLIRDYMYSKQTKLKLDRKYQKFSQMGKSLV